MRERRGEQRYVVDGLNLFVDGKKVDIVDVSPLATRVFLGNDEAPRDPVRLYFQSSREGLAFDAATDGWLVRQDEIYTVLGYRAPLENWPDRLKQFDTFRDVGIDVFDDVDWIST